FRPEGKTGFSDAPGRGRSRCASFRDQPRDSQLGSLAVFGDGDGGAAGMSSGCLPDSASQTAKPSSTRLASRRGGGADSPKIRRLTSTPSGIFALLSTASVPALTLVRPRFHRKKPPPLATTPRNTNTSHCIRLGAKPSREKPIARAATSVVATKPPSPSHAKSCASVHLV